jgi:hypothetical protein
MIILRIDGVVLLMRAHKLYIADAYWKHERAHQAVLIAGDVTVKTTLPCLRMLAPRY